MTKIKFCKIFLFLFCCTTKGSQLVPILLGEYRVIREEKISISTFNYDMISKLFAELMFESESQEPSHLRELMINTNMVQNYEVGKYKFASRPQKENQLIQAMFFRLSFHIEFKK